MEENDNNLEAFFNTWDNFMIELRKLNKEHEAYVKLRKEFCNQYANEVISLTLDYYPEMVADENQLKKDLMIHGVLLLDDVSDLTGHYERGENGYRFGLFTPEFNVYKPTEAQKAALLKKIKKQEVWEHMQKQYNKDYVDNFTFEVYRWYLFKLIKKLVPTFYKDVFNLTAQGFRELEGILYLKMIDTFEVIIETQDGKPYFDKVSSTLLDDE